MYSREYIRPSNERSKCRVVQGCSRSQKALYEISPIGLYGDPSKPFITLHFHAWAASEPNHRQIWFAFGDGRSGGVKVQRWRHVPLRAPPPANPGAPGCPPTRFAHVAPARTRTPVHTHARTHAWARKASAMHVCALWRPHDARATGPDSPRCPTVPSRPAVIPCRTALPTLPSTGRLAHATVAGPDESGNRQPPLRRLTGGPANDPTRHNRTSRSAD